MLRDFLNIKKLKKQEQNSSRDEKLNKNLLHRKNKNKLIMASRINIGVYRVDSIMTAKSDMQNIPNHLYYYIIFCHVDVFRCYWCVCTFQTWNFNK